MRPATPLPHHFRNDKESIAVDLKSGAVFVTWTQFNSNGSSPIVISKSMDGGITWSTAVQVNPVFSAGGITSYSQGSIPQANNGALYVAYESAVCQNAACNRPTDHDAIIVAKSTDGGQTFLNREVAVDYDFPLNADTGRSTLTNENFRINSFPQMTVDPTDGRLYLVWADDRNGKYDSQGNSVKTNGDVFLVSSNDGVRWTQPFRFGTAADEVFPAIAVYDRHVAITFYTRAYDADGINLDYAYVAPEDLSDLEDVHITRITKQSENPQVQFVSTGLATYKVLQGVFIGDYSAAAIGRDRVTSWRD